MLCWCRATPRSTGPSPKARLTNEVLACALEASADLTVIDDLHLLDLESY